LHDCNFFARLQLFCTIATFLHDCNFFARLQLFCDYFYTSYLNLFPHTFMTYKCLTIICTWFVPSKISLAFSQESNSLLCSRELDP
jgi:hypothetical protein